MGKTAQLSSDPNRPPAMLGGLGAIATKVWVDLYLVLFRAPASHL
jgi:hypothetical protein